ncbi:MAG: hypothetical protein KC635_04765 [Myxococcales bacterium]|nr:hypothetical protein [Myxococcales bacterium]MCB9734444.1 hypothetical protein [Deltaproteobacteria bacterium]
MNRRALVAIAAALTLGAGLVSAGCSKKAEPPETPVPTASPPPTAVPEPDDAGAAPTPSGEEDAAAPTSAAAADSAGAAAPSGPAPEELTNFDSPSLGDIPGKPIHGKVHGKAIENVATELEYGGGEWTIVVKFGDGESFVIPLDGSVDAPHAGTQVVRAKACCPGYLHRREPEGGKAVSLNAPNGAAIEITGWEVADWKDGGGMKQPGGKVQGRLAVAYDADNWVAGTFETDFEYFGAPPAVKAKEAEAAKAAAQEAVGAWKDLPAPEGVAIEPGKKVWAATVGSGSWRFGEVTVKSVDDGVITVDNDRFTVPGLVRAMTPVAPTKGAMVAAVDHLGPQFARVDAVGDPKVDVTYLNPASKPRDNQIALTRIFAWADSPAGAGMPATGFFDRDGTPAAGQVVAVSGADAIVIVDGGKELVKVPVASVTTAPGAKALRKGQAVVAIAGCGMNGWRPREGKVVDVIEGGIGYTVDADPCKGVTVAGNRLRAK